MSYPKGADHSGEYLKYFVTHSTEWPTWIPLKRVQNYLLSCNRDKGVHAVWICHCKQPGCHTGIKISVILTHGKTTDDTSVIQVEFFDDRIDDDVDIDKSTSPICCHWQHWREGGPTQFDLQYLDMKNKKADQIWEQDLMAMQGTEQGLFCNADGHFKDRKSVENYLAKYNEQHISPEFNVFQQIAGQPQKWMATLTQQGYNYKVQHLARVQRRGLEWNDCGWYHVLDLLNITISIYHEITCDPIAFYPQLLSVGIFVDDMSNLVQNIWGRKLCHSIAFVKHAAGRMGLMIFEFITGDWRQPTFETLFNEWWLFVTRRHHVKVPAFCTDWDRKLQSAICRVVNQMSLQKYLEITYKVPSGKADINLITSLMFSCHGHAAGAIFGIAKENLTQTLSRQVLEKNRLVSEFVTWQRTVSFSKWFVERKSISTQMTSL